MERGSLKAVETARAGATGEEPQVVDYPEGIVIREAICGPPPLCVVLRGGCYHCISPSYFRN